MIARIWRGAVARADADAYSSYMQRTGIPGYIKTPGNRDMWMLRRDIGELTEFVMLTLWDSIESIRALAGDSPEIAVFYPEDHHFLVERDEIVAHYSIDTHASR